MTGSNKILTVSYGTFSCTLEGFDDPFGTMRGIAEYFRDLAADDRYFGAEPPTPDVEMLQNIAQKEVNRRVEARVGETGLSLRQVDDKPKAPAEQPPAAETASKPIAATPEIAETLDHGPLAFDDDYLLSDEPEDVLTVDTRAAAPAKDAPAESVAEKLRRIRAVVSRTIEHKETSSAFDDAPDADSDAGAIPQTNQQRAMTRTIADITADLSDEDDDEETDAALADDAEEEFEEAPTLTLGEDAAENADTSLITSIVASDDEVEQADTPSDNMFEDTNDTSEDGDKAASDAFDAALSAAIANVSAASRQDDDEAVADVAEADADDTTATASQVDETPEAEHSPVEEDVAAVAEDEDTFEDENDLDDTRTEDQFAARVVATLTERKATAPLEPLSETNGNVGRLLQETDEQFNDGDGIRRRRVISQMRAAVAATKADRILSRIIPRDEQDAEQQDAYRQDLSRAMTRRPSFSEVARAEEAVRPAPLVLVSSQRVDQMKTPEPIETAPDVTPAPADAVAEASNFQEFAINMGATELPDLLEAAAAYTAFVKGQPHFSRPEIMKRVARVDPALEVSREAGLRSFGQLLRQGKIHKLQRGQFTVPETTRFNPAQRIAGE